MSTKNRDRKPPRKPGRGGTTNGNGVGYGKPPRAHQFKPGQSGNPKGRAKGTKNESTILNELLHRKIDIREGGRPRKIPIIEAILLRIVEDSLKGNTKSATFILNRFGAMVSGEIQRADLSEDDREILEAFSQKLVAQLSTTKEEP